MTSRSRSLLLLIAVLLLVFPGCGSDRPGTVPVKGTVRYQGNVVEGARVMFMATGATSAQAPAANGITDAEGRFTLMTFVPGDGAAVGQYKVLITKRQEMPDPKQPNSPYKITRDLFTAQVRQCDPDGPEGRGHGPAGPTTFPFELKD